MHKCTKCWMIKATDKSKCLCSAKPFNEKKFEAKKPIAQISEKKKQRLEDSWTEIQLFKTRFNMLKAKWLNRCIVSWVLIEHTEDNDLEVSQFPHWFPKWKYPEMRYMLNNIFLVKWIKEHNIFDSLFKQYRDEKWSHDVMNKIISWIELYDDILDFIKNTYDKEM